MNLIELPDEINKHIIKFNGNNNNVFSTINKQWYNLYSEQFDKNTSIDKINNIMNDEIISWISIHNFEKNLRKKNTSI